MNTATAANWANAISDIPRQREHLSGTVNTGPPASARFAQCCVFTANDAFVFIFSVGEHSCDWKADSPATMAEQQAIGKTAQRASAQVTAHSQSAAVSI